MVTILLKDPIRLTEEELRRAEISHTANGPVYFTFITRVHMSGGNIIAIINVDTGYEYGVKAMLTKSDEDYREIASEMLRLAREI